MGNENALTVQLQETPVSEEVAKSLKSEFLPFYEQAQGWQDKAMKIIITDPDQTELMQQAREARLDLKRIRVETEHLRKQKKEGIVREGKAIDGLANIIKFLIVPIEEHLQEQEDFVKVQEEKRKAELLTTRTAELSPFVEDTSYYSLGEMPEETYAELLKNSKGAQQAKLEAERKVEEDRITAEKALAEDRIRIEKENRKLKKDLKQTTAVLEQKEEEEVKAEEVKKEEIEAANAAPDKAKLQMLIHKIQDIQLPFVEGKEAKKICTEVNILLGKVCKHIETKSKAL